MVAYEGSPASISLGYGDEGKGAGLERSSQSAFNARDGGEGLRIFAMTEMHEVAIEEEHGEAVKGKLFLWRQGMGMVEAGGGPFGRIWRSIGPPQCHLGGASVGGGIHQKESPEGIKIQTRSFRAWLETLQGFVDVQQGDASRRLQPDGSIHLCQAVSEAWD
jgi:hypothetical protein